MTDGTPPSDFKLAALDVLVADLTFALLDAEAAAAEAERAHRLHAARLSRADAAMCRAQLDVLAEARAALLAGRPQITPATPDFRPARTQSAAAGTS